MSPSSDRVFATPVTLCRSKTIRGRKTLMSPFAAHFRSIDQAPIKEWTMRLVYRLTTATVIAAAVLTFGYISLRGGLPTADRSPGQAAATTTDAKRESAYAYCLKSQVEGCEFMWLAPSD
jgi:hypothetical protein